MIKRVSAIAVSFLMLAGCNGAASDEAGNSDETYIKAHTVQQLMAGVVQPTADVYWGAVQYISDETGQHDIQPQTDEDWAKARNAAVTISEMGNLLMTPVYAEGRGEDWIQFSRSLIEVGQRAEKAAADHDVDAVFEVGGTIYSVCSACHQVYPPANGAAPSVPGSETPAT